MKIAPRENHLSRERWFSRALAFRSLYYPWEKWGLLGSLKPTTLSENFLSHSDRSYCRYAANSTRNSAFFMCRQGNLFWLDELYLYPYYFFFFFMLYVFLTWSSEDCSGGQLKYRVLTSCFSVAVVVGALVSFFSQICFRADYLAPEARVGRLLAAVRERESRRNLA